MRHLLTQEFSKTGQSSDEAVSSATNTTLESINQHGYMYPNFVEAHIGRYLLRGDLEGKHEVVETRLSEGSQSSSAPSLLQPSTWTPFELKMSRFLASIIQQRYETVGRVLVNTLCGGSSRRAALTDSNSSTLVIPHLYNMSNKFKQNRNKLERELKALSSFYFMLSGYVWHPFCAALFDRVSSDKHSTFSLQPNQKNPYIYFQLKSKQSTHHTGASLYNMFMDVLAAAEEVETDRSARYSCIGFDAGRVGIRVTDEELLQGINGGVGGSSWVVKDIIHLLEGVRFDYEVRVGGGQCE